MRLTFDFANPNDALVLMFSVTTIGLLLDFRGFTALCAGFVFTIVAVSLG